MLWSWFLSCFICFHSPSSSICLFLRGTECLMTFFLSLLHLISIFLCFVFISFLIFLSVWKLMTTLWTFWIRVRDILEVRMMRFLITMTKIPTVSLYLDSQFLSILSHFLFFFSLVGFVIFCFSLHCSVWSPPWIVFLCFLDIFRSLLFSSLFLVLRFFLLLSLPFRRRLPNEWLPWWRGRRQWWRRWGWSWFAGHSSWIFTKESWKQWYAWIIKSEVSEGW